MCAAGGMAPAIIVERDVHAFPGHIACDSRSQSEVVVPVFGPDGALIAVFDVDSDQPAAFDETDARWLERILAAVFNG
jgi:L-methionine (R)-S-oxide reductase